MIQRYRTPDGWSEGGAATYPPAPRKSTPGKRRPGCQGLSAERNSETPLPLPRQARQIAPCPPGPIPGHPRRLRYPGRPRRTQRQFSVRYCRLDVPSTMLGFVRHQWWRHVVRDRRRQQRSAGTSSEVLGERQESPGTHIEVQRRDDPLDQSVSAAGEHATNDE